MSNSVGTFRREVWSGSSMFAHTSLSEKWGSLQYIQKIFSTEMFTEWIFTMMWMAINKSDESKIIYEPAMWKWYLSHRLRQACIIAQSHQNLPCSHTQYIGFKASDTQPKIWLHWMAVHENHLTALHNEPHLMAWLVFGPRQANLLLIACASSKSRGTFRQKARSLAPLNGWACAVKICHDGMLEDTNSLDGAHLVLGSIIS